MRVEPPCVAKKLSNAKSGEVIKLHWGDHVMKVIVASMEDQGQQQQALVFLDSSGTQDLFNRQLQGPWMSRASLGDDPIVLSFGSAYSFHIDPAAARMVPEGRQQPTGALLIRGIGPALVVDLPNHPARRTTTFDTVTGVVGGPTFREEQVAILDWEVRLSGAHDDHPPFFAFKAA